MKNCASRLAIVVRVVIGSWGICIGVSIWSNIFCADAGNFLDRQNLSKGEEECSEQ